MNWVSIAGHIVTPLIVGLLVFLVARRHFRRSAARTIDEREHFRRLADAERQYRLLTEHATDMISRHDPDGLYTYASPASRALLGYEPDELLGHSAYEFFHPDDVPAIQESHLSIIEQPEYSTVAFRMRRKDGVYAWLETTSRTIRDESGAVVELIAITRDIEERVAGERRLEEARQAAETASQAKSEFLARMSHEIKTPLNAILGYSELLATRITDEEQQKWLELIRRAGGNLLQLLNNTLDLGTIEAGALSARPVPTSIAQVVQDVIEIFRAPAEQRGVAMEHAVSGTVPNLVLVDDTRLRQILMNLVANAVKFTPAGSIAVRVRGERASEHAINLHIDVVDSGIGIAPDEIERIFAPFERGRVTAESGTGLGLAISRHLAEIMGGTVDVSSTPGAGSVFTVELPELAVADELSATSPVHGRGDTDSNENQAEDRGLAPGVRELVIAAIGPERMGAWRRLFRVKMLDGIARMARDLEQIATENGASALARDASALAVAARQYDVEAVDALAPRVESTLFGDHQ